MPVKGHFTQTTLMKTIISVLNWFNVNHMSSIAKILLNSYSFFFFTYIKSLLLLLRTNYDTWCILTNLKIWLFITKTRMQTDQLYIHSTRN
jgi:hypothetical protein